MHLPCGTNLYLTAVKQADRCQQDDEEEQGHPASGLEIISGSVAARLENQGVDLMGRQDKVV